MVELLSPAGSFDSLRAAVHAGADAVYIGGSMFGARAYADNPEEDLLIRGIEYCHLHGRKIYLTVNTLLKDRELESVLYDYILPYYKHGIDGLIIQDLGVVQFVRKHFPDLPVHASTQMTVTGADGARFLKELGLTRIVPARELSLKEIKTIIDETGIEVETFIHGAMCYSYSGQCLLSSMIGGRSGNRGRCAQPCRLPYSANVDGKAYSGYLLSMKDMCTIDLLPDLIDAGIASMKIEGRMKRPEYAAGVVSIYRKYIDLYVKKGRKGYRVSEEDRRILMDLYNRGGFSDGYYRQHNGQSMMSMERPNHYGTDAAVIRSVQKGIVQMSAVEVLNPKDVLEFPDGTEYTLNESVKSGAVFKVKTKAAKLKNGAMVRRTKNEQLLNGLQEKYLKEDLKVKIKGELIISSENPAILRLECNGIHAEVSAEVAQAAQNNPATEESVRKQMNKTGNTPFAFEKLMISLDDGLFVPIKQLNELRREGLEQLERKMIQAAGRDSEIACGAAEIEKAERTHSDSCRLNILVTQWEQLNVVVQKVKEEQIPELHTVYFDTLLFGTGKNTDAMCGSVSERIHVLQEKGILCYINMPVVFRQKERELFQKHSVITCLMKMDGFLLHTVDELSWSLAFMAEHGKTFALAADDNMYTYNRRAAEFFRSCGVERVTFPAELNEREMRILMHEHMELNVYGYQALMHSAQCVRKNTAGCSGKPQIIWMKDRKHVQFPVLNRCSVCCNTIYNSVPLQLDECMDSVKMLSPEWIRLTFTIENAEETERVINRYRNVFFGTGKNTAAEQEGTRGHFRRGVE